MSKTRRKFSPEERLSILQECEREGLMATCRKYSLSPSLFNHWKDKYLAQGMQGLKPAYKRVDPQVRELELENARLKKIIAMQALELEVKSELLKKNTYPTQEKVKIVKQYGDQVTGTSLCQWIGLPRSVYYYKPRSGRPGAKASTHTRKADGTIVSNEAVISQIRELLLREFC